MVWISHDRRNFDQLMGSAQDMAKKLHFSDAHKIASLISQCYYLHSLYDDGDNELSKRYSRTDYDIQLFRELADLFQSIYTLTGEPDPEKQAVLQSRWWYYFSRKDVPEILRLVRVSIPFLGQQILKIGNLRKGMHMGYILARAGYQHNRDYNKTQSFLERYWEEAKSLQNNIMMF